MTLDEFSREARRIGARECAEHLGACAAQCDLQAKDADGAAREMRRERAKAYRLAADELRRAFDVLPRDAA